MLTVSHDPEGVQAFAPLRSILEHAGLRIVVHPLAMPIPGSYWGEPEAGLIGNTVHARVDTPLHSLLHESCHALCMSTMRRRVLRRDAGGDDLEECAVCYLQLCIADCIQEIGLARLAHDMDEWGYSFRAGSTLQWFVGDAHDAREWLLSHPDVIAPLPVALRERIESAAIPSC